MSQPPLSLYIHTPWCVQKCPYCDFNSHEGSIDAEGYLAQLKQDFLQDLPQVQGRPISSVFIGGGTPSLLDSSFYQQLFDFLRAHVEFSQDCEITLEANPGTAEAQRFGGYREAGINRLSLGVQSFDGQQLQGLGRIHGPQEAIDAVTMARQAGFERLNLDLMFALPKQTVGQALADLEQAFALRPDHLSWYQLTIEPNTAFYKSPPPLPDEDLSADIWQAGQQALAAQGFEQYEISAYCRPGEASRHNLAYWSFADYLGIGAGAHGKITDRDGQVWRSQKTRTPKNYLASLAPALAAWQPVASDELAFEIMLNLLRRQTGNRPDWLPSLPQWALTRLHGLAHKGLIDAERLLLTKQGWPFYNDIVAEFLP